MEQLRTNSEMGGLFGWCVVGLHICDEQLVACGHSRFQQVLLVPGAQHHRSEVLEKDI